MKRLDLPALAREYANNGQHAEQVFRYALTGERKSADNTPASVAPDVLDIQIKSARATVCKGLDLDEYLARDTATRYAYVTADFLTAYVMDKREWREFCQTFGTITRESDKNGGAPKIRLRYETPIMREWLDKRA